MKKLLAFTLAETLIVIGIIGVVSALTLPNLNSSTGEKEKVAKVKKIYQNLDDALGRAVAVYGPVGEWFVNDTTEAAQVSRFAGRITEFLKVSKNCGVSAGCWSTNPFYLIDGTKLKNNYYQSISALNGLSVILADGTALAFLPDVISRCEFRIHVDIDGPNKGQNKDGIDVFHFLLYEYELVPDTAYSDPTEGDFYRGANGSQNMTSWIILNDNMDYLKCPEELNWETKTSCK